MRVLLDECLPRPLKRDLPGHDVYTVPEMGWAGVKNGALLRLVEPDFDIFVTIDGNMKYQQNLSALDLAFVVLTAINNKLETLQPLMPQILDALMTIQPGQIVKVAALSTP
jgi:hypothetical protein